MPTNTAPVRTEQIPIDKITPSPFQVRQDFDAEKLKAFAQDIQDHGMINAINVRPVGDHFELIAGERRWRAAKLLGWQTLEAKIEEVDDSEAAQRGLVENLQREDLSPIERGQGFKKLSDPPFNMSLDEIAQIAGFTDHQVVSRFIALLKLPQEIQDLVSRDTISETHIRYLNRIKDADQFIQAARSAAKGGWSVKETEKRVNALLDKSGRGSSPPPLGGTANASVGGPPPVSDSFPAQPAPLISPDPAKGESPANPTTSQTLAASSQEGKELAPQIIQSPPVWSNSSPTSTLITAVKDEVLDRVLPWQWGRIGWVLRDGLDKLWHYRWVRKLALWMGITLLGGWLIRWTLPWILPHTSPALPHTETVQEKDTEKPKRFTMSTLSSVPVPHGLRAELIGGHRLRFTWDPVGPDYRYNIYSAYGNFDNYEVETPKPTSLTTGVWEPHSKELFKFVVTAVDKEDRESAYSAPIEVDLR